MRLKNVRPAISRVHVLAVLLACAAFPVTAATFETPFQRQLMGRYLLNNVPTEFDYSPTAKTALTSSGSRLVMATPATATINSASVPVMTTVKSTAAATGKLAVALAKVAGPVGVAVAAYDLFQAVQGFNVTYAAPGQLDITKQSTSIECQFQYRHQSDTDWYCTGVEAVRDRALTYAANSMGAGWSANGFVFYEATMSGNWNWVQPDGNSFNAGAQGGSEYIKRVNPNPPASAQIVPATEQELIDAIATQSGWPASDLIEKVGKAALETGQPIEIDHPESTVTGPASTPPKVEQTTNPDGSSTTKTTTNNYTYQGNTITHNTTTDVKTCTGVGSCSTSTTTTTNQPPAPTTKTDCEKNPKAAGCAELGEAPDAVPLNKTTRALDITAAAFSSSAACPSPVAVDAFGHSYQIPYDPVCDKLALLKPLMMMFAAFIAAYILADSFKV